MAFTNHIFSVVERRCRTTEFLAPPPPTEETVRSCRPARTVMKHYQNNHRTRIRETFNDLGSSSTTTHRIQRKNSLFLYHDTFAQELIYPDVLARVEFFNRFSENNIPHTVLWADLSTFTRTEGVNFHNTHTWLMKILIPQSEHQFSIYVWSWIVDGNIFVPYFSPSPRRSNCSSECTDVQPTTRRI